MFVYWIASCNIILFKVTKFDTKQLNNMAICKFIKVETIVLFYIASVLDQ